MQERTLNDGDRFKVPVVAKKRGDGFDLVPDGISGIEPWHLSATDATKVRGIVGDYSGTETTSRR